MRRKGGDSGELPEEDSTGQFARRLNREFLFRPIRNAGIASNVMLNVKEMLN